MLSSLINNKKVISVYKPIEFEIVDNEQISDEFNVVVSAREQAKKNLPRETASEPDFNEVDYRKKMQTKVMQSSHSVQQALNDIGNSINNFSVDNEINEAKRIDRKYDEEIASIFAEKKSELIEAKRQLELTDEDLHQFRRTNRINREADYPKSSIMGFGVIAILVIFEVLLNGTFFAKGSDEGLMGGVSIAIIISLINVGVGFFVGAIFFRRANLISNGQRILARLSYCVFFLLAIGFNYLVAVWRKALETSPDNTEEQFWVFLDAGVSSIWDVNSLGLFAIGLFFFSVAVYKGYVFDDVYPSYGKISRKRDDARDVLSEERRELSELINEKHEEYVLWLEDKYGQIKLLKRNLSSSISSFEQQKSIFENYVTHLEGALEYMLKLYRDTNSSERNGPAPDYFNNPIDAKIPFEPFVFVKNDKTKEIQASIDAFTQHKPNILDALSHARQKYLVLIAETCD